SARSQRRDEPTRPKKCSTAATAAPQCLQIIQTSLSALKTRKSSAKSKPSASTEPKASVLPVVVKDSSSQARTTMPTAPPPAPHVPPCDGEEKGVPTTSGPSQSATTAAHGNSVNQPTSRSVHVSQLRRSNKSSTSTNQ